MHRQFMTRLAACTAACPTSAVAPAWRSGVHSSRAAAHRGHPRWLQASTAAWDVERSYADAEAEAAAAEAEESAALTPIEQFKLRLPQFAAVAGGLVVVYGMSKVTMFVTSSLMNVNFSTVAWVGFGAGMLTAGLSGLGLTAARRLVRIRPEVVFQAAVKEVKANKEVQALLGGGIRGGELRAYTVRTGKFGLDDDKRLKWLEPRAQMLFQATGKKGAGMVSLEAVRHNTNLVFNMITVDVMDGDDSDGFEPRMVVVAGDPERLEVRGQLRAFLQSERVKYIEQTRSES